MTMAACPAGRCRGFTLLELLIAVAIGAMLVQIAVMNLGALVPASIMDSAANQFVARLDFVRSEAMLNSKPYRIEVDLANHRWRTVMPLEAHLVSLLEPDQKFASTLWDEFDERIECAGYRGRSGDLVKRGVVQIEFDEHGFTGDHVLYLRLRADDRMVWSILVRGLVGTAAVLPSEDGQFATFEQVNEAAF
jgi:prepilin-type N-terminal cleavage/methylation domain-containing protein